jgi:hypothetical protein
MHVSEIITRLAQQAQTIRTLVEGVDEDQARWKPTPESWSILEVVNHLYDEEREDFRARVDHILHRPDEPAPPIDPQGWVTQRGYNQRNLAESLTNFLAEREKSLTWLATLDAPVWESAYKAPWGALYAGDVFVSWAAHDLLHTRQLVELHYLHGVRSAAPYSVEYAGEW